MGEPARVLIFEVAPGFERWRGAQATVERDGAQARAGTGWVELPMFRLDDGTLLFGGVQVLVALDARAVAHAQLENPEMCREMGL